MNAGQPTIAELESRLLDGRAERSAWFDLGGLKLASGDVNGAILAYRECLSRGHSGAALHNNLAAALMRVGRPADAVVELHVALKQQPGYLRAAVNLGKALCEVGRIEESIAHLTATIKAHPEYVPALVNLGQAQCTGNQLADARRNLLRAAQLEPQRIEIYSTLAWVDLRLGETNLAIQRLRAALSSSPSHPDAHLTLAHVLFVTGDWSEAWAHFEYRFHSDRYRAQPSPAGVVSRWDGRPFTGNVLWLQGEQGLGDQLQFCRYAATLRQAGYDCVLSVNPRLVQLLTQSAVAGRVVPWGGQQPPDHARGCHLMSLPAWHGTTMHYVPLARGYLQPDPARLASWRVRLPPGRRIAFAWTGNTQMETGLYAGRSPPLEALAPLWHLDAQFICLQQGANDAHFVNAPFRGRVHRYDDLDSGPDAFLDSAAVLAQVEVLITSDTAIAHLAGALGVKTCLCLMHEPDWRWMRSGETTPWYDSIRVFRQPAPGDWRSVFQAVAAALARIN